MRQMALGILLVLTGARCAAPVDDQPADELTSRQELAFPGRSGELRRGVFDTPAGTMELAYEWIDGLAVHQGDIILSRSRSTARGAHISWGDVRWPGGVVAYSIDSTLPADRLDEIEGAIAMWEQSSRFTFVPSATGDHVVFRPGPGCDSEYGRIGGAQTIHVADWCTAGNVAHEIGHALGLHHEHARTDREDHIEIHEENIVPDDEEWFETYEAVGGRNVGPYDIESIMHYDSYSASVNYLPTITRLDGTTFEANREYLTDTDVCAAERFNNPGRRFDITGDGYGDLAIASPNERILEIAQGHVTVLHGGPAGMSGAIEQWFFRGQIGVQGDVEEGAEFGMAMATGDFDGDCRSDLAIGVPGEDVNGHPEAGVVQIFYGTFLGLSLDEIFHQDQAGVVGDSEDFGHFGAALAVGDFNGDGLDDLAVGGPDEDAGGVTDAGRVTVLRGKATGLVAAGSERFSQDQAAIADQAEANDHFGSVLVAADFNSDGFDELAVGVPHEDSGAIADAGAIHVLIGSIDGLVRDGDLYFDQNDPNVTGSATAVNRFAQALAAGDFNADGFKDLVIGIPYDDIAGESDAGRIVTVSGGLGGLNLATAEAWTQGTSGSGTSELTDQFGSSLATGDFDGDGADDVAIGAPCESLTGQFCEGAVTVMYGANITGLASAGSQIWHQNSPGVPDSSEALDSFGRTLATGDFNGDWITDLAIGVPFEGVGAAGSAGAVEILYGGSGGITSSAAVLLTQDTTGNTAEAGDGFGLALP